jgi:hypothetical protein
VCECTKDSVNIKADNTYARTTVFKGVHDSPCFYSFSVLDMCIATSVTRTTYDDAIIQICLSFVGEIMLHLTAVYLRSVLSVILIS